MPANLFKVLFRRLFPPLFTVRIRDGRALAAGGKVTSAFLEDVSGIASRSGIRSGWIWGFRAGAGVRLDFSSNICEGDRQRLRNTAGIHRF